MKVEEVANTTEDEYTYRCMLELFNNKNNRIQYLKKLKIKQKTIPKKSKKLDFNNKEKNILSDISSLRYKLSSKQDKHAARAFHKCSKCKNHAYPNPHTEHRRGIFNVNRNNTTKYCIYYDINIKINMFKQNKKCQKFKLKEYYLNNP